ncbi:deoxyribodipyrimidine photo-lyase [Acinetobacter sp. R933-2]|uniref:cryptochrome/photolyase family protein n=1 Tax=Acinetobacter sp. R933-2 TaxID=2746728 RepID=UPI0025770CFF|nr:deoxyribodipyrimidine photo-lyase [Acinetobacter sp. R933-2]MDM1247190.1 deoxyribodipyrimidine photo-lyase [Acinetobacter sp. R933-2]
MQLVWFRQDLRITDHAALWHASQTGKCIALVMISIAQWQQHDDAACKISLYLRQIETLKRQLAQLNIPLIIQDVPLWKDVPQQLYTVVQDLKIENVFANIELGINEQKRDTQVNVLLNQHNILLNLYHDRTLFPVGSILNQSNQPYKVFGAFKKRCYELLSIRVPSCYPTPEPQPSITLDDSLDLEIITQHIAALDHKDLADSWSVRENYAESLLDDFLEHKLAYYAEERDFPNLSATSQLSAYLNMGAISIRQCIHGLFREQLGNFHLSGHGQQIWLDELLWREFYQHILFTFPHVSKHQPFKENTNKIKWLNNDNHLQAWQQGQTGIPIVDAGMRQLKATGWMHNRVRMITAMFLTKNLLIDWRKGEKWFMQHLIDGDLAANNGGWQWCASTGTDAVPYFRVFNPTTQSQKFDPEGEYIKRWVPELAHLDAKQIHAPFAKNPNLALNYPHPLVDLGLSRKRAIEAFKLI